MNNISSLIMKSVVVLGICLVCITAVQAHVAQVTVSAADTRKSITAEDAAALKACPIWCEGKVNYTEEAHLAIVADSIKAYFAAHPLQQDYILRFYDAGQKSFVGTPVRIEQHERVQLVQNTYVNQLLMGIIAAVLAVLFFLICVKVSKKRGTLSTLLEVLCLLAGLAFGVLSAICVVSLGIKLLIMVCGPALLLIGVILVVGMGGKHRRSSSDSKLPTTSAKPQGGYVVAGKHFDTWADAYLYTQQFSYMDKSWIEHE